MHTGIVKFFKNESGFGFVVPDDGSTDVFLHVSNWEPKGTYPREGQRVEFDTVIDRKKGKLTATNCRAA